MHFLVCRYLIAQCHYACVEYEEALNILEDSEKCPSHLLNTSITALVTGCMPKCHTPNNSGQKLDKPMLARVRNSLSNCAENELLGGFTWKSLQSSVALLKGKIHEGLENRVVAVQYYREALILDVTCYEAFEKLIHFQSATALEEITLLVQLDFAGQLEPKMAKLVEFLYEDKISKHCTPLTKIPEELDALHENVDLAVNMAGRMLDLCQFQKCYDITSKIMCVDPYNLACLPIHVSVLKELDKPNGSSVTMNSYLTVSELFSVAHKLMNIYPSNAISWFAVGCYYLCTQRNELARRHLLKASQLDKCFGPTWLALGHAFASDGEHDQAIASYCTAAQVIQGSHVPIMYIGIEYSASNNRNLADRFLFQAYKLNSSDPFIMHEFGTLAFQKQDYSQAIHMFSQAYDRACELGGQVPSAFWEPLVNNMAHTYRKLGVYDRALSMHQIALRLVPDSPSTLASIALVHAMTGELAEAVDYLHRSLCCVHSAGTGGNAFASTMLTICIDLLTNKSFGKRPKKPGKDIPDSPPQRHLARAVVGSVPGSEKICFKKRSPDVSATSKSSANALHLDVMYHTFPTETPSRSLNTSDEDVTMELG
ncbi:Anaphase-promoting complex subunit 6 [Paragonimus heterotremus]|uniref:Anaphase-promoting complex subunit 6 n=1 Tax=Paragonimus heterotremus TaxID=100268 RepID=A0A8J4T540_9TREM|nr:Anaphase-promoting complex subunit 6 [Paragonimus heterotremus]